MEHLTALFAAILDIIRPRVVDFGELSLNLDSDALFADLHHGRW